MLESNKKASLVTYILVGVIGVSLIFLGGPLINTTQLNQIASVNGQSIGIQEYNNYLSQLQNKQPEADVTQLRQIALQQLLTRYAYGAYIHDGEYTVSDARVLETIEAQFGSLNNEDYRMVLRRNGLTPREYERQLRLDRAVDQYTLGVLHSEFVLNPEIDDLIVYFGNQYALNVVTIGLDAFSKNIIPSEEVLREYYASRPDDFHSPQRYSLSYVSLNVDDVAAKMEVSDEELQTAYAQYADDKERRSGEYFFFENEKRAAEGLKQLQAGEDEALRAALEKSGGEYGTLDLQTRSSGVSKEVTATLFALEKEGDLSEVVKTDFGPVVIRLGKIETDNLKTLEEMRQELSQKIQRQKAEEPYFRQENGLRNGQQNGLTLASLAAIAGKEVAQTGMLDVGDLPTWARTPEAQAQLAKLGKGQVSEPLAFGDEGLVILSIEDAQAPQRLSFEDAQEDVRLSYINNEAQKRADAVASQLQEASADPKAWQAILTEYALQEEKFNQVSRLNFPQGMSPLLFNQIMGELPENMKEGQLRIYTLPDARAVVRFGTVQAGKLEDFGEQELAQIKSAVLQENVYRLSEEMARYAFSVAKIKTYPERIALAE